VQGSRRAARNLHYGADAPGTAPAEGRGAAGEHAGEGYLKKRSIRNSITARITLWFSAVIIVIVTLIFLIFRIVSASVLQKTVREYLLSVVGENTDKIRYLDDREEADPKDRDDVFIRYGEGWLEIDDDFLDRVYEVESALYTTGGKMLYGKNPIARQMDGEPFTTSRVYDKEVNGIRYYVYDRKQSGEQLEDLWIRGVVAIDAAQMQLESIGRSTVLFVPILLFLGIAGGFLIAQRMLMPLRRIEEAASEISRGTDLARRIEIGGGEDEIHDLADAFNGMLDRLERSFEAEQRFTSDASHELRTPMSVILAQTELALEKERSGEDYRRAIRVIERQGRRMSALISSMLDYTRLEMHAERYPFEVIDFSALTRSVAEDMALLQVRGIAVAVCVEEGILVSGSSILLERLLQNLIDNAYKYGKEGGHTEVRLLLAGEDEDPAEACAAGASVQAETSRPKAAGASVQAETSRLKAAGTMVQAETSRPKAAGASGQTETSGKTALLAVRDDGPGIPQEHLGKIFDRFYRADPSRSANVPGSGLGLSMVQKIAVMHGGSVEVRSEPGEGTAFYVRIPYVDNPAGQERKKEKENEKRRKREKGRGGGTDGSFGNGNRGKRTGRTSGDRGDRRRCLVCPVCRPQKRHDRDFDSRGFRHSRCRREGGGSDRSVVKAGEGKRTVCLCRQVLCGRKGI